MSNIKKKCKQKPMNFLKIKNKKLQIQLQTNKICKREKDGDLQKIKGRRFINFAESSMLPLSL